LVDADRAEARIARLEELIEPPPSNYADIFRILGRNVLLEEDLASRLGSAAQQRNLLVHLYMEVDDRAVFASLAFLDDLRQFAVFAQSQLD
jgi:uncharacterized protein YutE (UPF0331/DUF86 family)